MRKTMRLTKKDITEITQLESFRSFFADSLDKKLQYSDLDELAKFVFGSIEKAVLRFLSEEDQKYLRKALAK